MLDFLFVRGGRFQVFEPVLRGLWYSAPPQQICASQHTRLIYMAPSPATVFEVGARYTK